MFTKLGVCEGDCDWDIECEEGLKCWHTKFDHSYYDQGYEVFGSLFCGGQVSNGHGDLPQSNSIFSYFLNILFRRTMGQTIVTTLSTVTQIFASMV